jgi:hypothetical protein
MFASHPCRIRFVGLDRSRPCSASVFVASQSFPSALASRRVVMLQPPGAFPASCAQDRTTGRRYDARQC